MMQRSAQKAGVFRRAKLGLGAVVVVAVFAVGVVWNAIATTGPDQGLLLRAVMTNSRIVILRTGHDAQYVNPGGSTAAFPRGAVIRFSVMNQGSKPLVPAVHVLNTAGESPFDHPLKYYTAPRAALPGQTVELDIDFYFRARYEMLVLYHGKPIGKVVSINIQ